MQQTHTLRSLTVWRTKKPRDFVAKTMLAIDFFPPASIGETKKSADSDSGKEIIKGRIIAITEVYRLSRMQKRTMSLRNIVRYNLKINYIVQSVVRLDSENT